MSGDLTGIMINTVDGPLQANENDLRAAGWVPASEAQAAIDQGNATIKDCRWFLFEFASKHGLQDELKAALVARLEPAPGPSRDQTQEGGPDGR